MCDLWFDIITVTFGYVCGCVYRLINYMSCEGKQKMGGLASPCGSLSNG